MAGIAKQKNQGGRHAKHWAAPKGTDPGLIHGFRSGLEDANAKHLEAARAPFLFEGIKIKYVIPETFHTYTPDFLLLDNGIIVETKGEFVPADRKKHLFLRAQYPDLDIRLVFQRPSDKINKGSNTTYAVWCDKYGIKWAFKLVPLDWLKEPGPKHRPEDVVARGPNNPFREGEGG